MSTHQPELISDDARLGVFEVADLEGAEAILRRDGWSWLTATPITGGYRLECERVTPQGTHERRLASGSINTPGEAADAVAVPQGAET